MLSVSTNAWLGASIMHQQTDSRRPGTAASHPHSTTAQDRFLRYASKYIDRQILDKGYNTAGPNEQSVISRENLGFYHALIVAAVYPLPSSFNPYLKASFYSALKGCVGEHSYLSVTLEDANTDKAYFKRVSTINLDKHVYIKGLQQQYTSEDLEDVLASGVDTPFPRDVPPWKVIVYPHEQNCLVAFAFSHALGDGIFGKAFHRTFSQALNDPKSSVKTTPPIIQVISGSLPGPFDTPERLPISWSYLISSSIAYLVPSLLGRRASASSLDVGTWLGAPISIAPTRMKLREVPAATLEKAIQVARGHNAKLTGLFQHLVAKALSKHLPADPSVTNFVCATAINMRKSIGASDDEGGLFTSGCAITYPRQDPVTMNKVLTEEDWSAIASTTRQLAEAWSTTQDQFIGLLKYLPSIRKWLANKEGTQRSCSFQVSNIGVLETLHDDLYMSGGNISDVIFATPGEVTGGPLKFTMVSLKGGSLRYVVSWRKVALDVGELDEGQFVESLCSSSSIDLRPGELSSDLPWGTGTRQALAERRRSMLYRS